jgi:hypothetical protein
MIIFPSLQSIIVFRVNELLTLKLRHVNLKFEALKGQLKLFRGNKDGKDLDVVAD